MADMHAHLSACRCCTTARVYLNSMPTFIQVDRNNNIIVYIVIDKVLAHISEHSDSFSDSFCEAPPLFAESPTLEAGIQVDQHVADYKPQGQAWIYGPSDQWSMQASFRHKCALFL